MSRAQQRRDLGLPPETWAQVKARWRKLERRKVAPRDPTDLDARLASRRAALMLDNGTQQGTRNVMVYPQGQGLTLEQVAEKCVRDAVNKYVLSSLPRHE